jgi:hypothetical protein
MSVFGLITSKILNTAGVQINPATDEKLDAILTAVTGTGIIKKYDAGNSTNAPLIANDNYTGQWIDVTDYSLAITIVKTDQDAAVDGLEFQSSDDGVVLLHSHPFSPTINTPYGHHYPTTLDSNYFRISYTNGPTPQGEFTISTVFFKNPPEEGHVHPVEFVIDKDHPASVGRSILVAKSPSGAYGNIGRTAGGNLKISLEEVEPAITDEIGIHPKGAGANGLVTLTDADTAYAVPPIAPVGSYRITIENISDSVVYTGYENASINGLSVPPGGIVKDNLGAGQQLFFYCSSAGKEIAYTIKGMN